MVLPSVLKLARRGMVVVTVISTAPLCSAYVAAGMILLANVSEGEAGAVMGSRLKVMRSLPGSVATVGFTGAVKLKTRREGSSGDTVAVKWMATLPMNRRPDS